MRLYRRLYGLVSILVSACTAFTSSPANSKDGVSVSLHGVNYTAVSFQYVLIDPQDPSNTGGGEHVGPFSAGGIMCCYELPKQWKPGIRVEVQATHWVKKGDGKLEEIRQVHMVEVPPYVGGKPGELWVLHNKEGSVELVSSDFQPNHPDWPGRVKGWPEPSLEYQRERWDLYKRIAEHSVKSIERLLKDLKENPEKRASEAWAYDKRYGYEIDLTQFSGPEDPAYRAHLKKDYEEGLVDAQNRLEKIISRKP